MSYSILAGGTQEEAARTVTHLCDSNASPEMPIVKTFLLDLIEAVEGDEKRVHINAQGYHSGGLVSHNIDFKTSHVQG